MPVFCLPPPPAGEVDLGGFAQIVRVRADGASGRVPGASPRRQTPNKRLKNLKSRLTSNQRAMINAIRPRIIINI